jgi:hypothetical protein
MYRYRILPEKTEQCLAIQKRAGQIYDRHIRSRVVIIRSREDPRQWLEIHWYPNEETYRRGMNLINAEPEIDQLWQEFQETLDPTDPTIREEFYEQLSFEDNLTVSEQDST